MFDGEKCIRCNKKFKFEELTLGPAGFSICKACAARINIEGKEKRRCHVDDQEMGKRVLGLMLVDQCVACGGIWFDAEEMKVFKDWIRREIWAKGIGLEILWP